MRAHACTHAHTHTHTTQHTHIHRHTQHATCSHTHARTHAHASMRAHTHTHCPFSVLQDLDVIFYYYGEILSLWMFVLPCFMLVGTVLLYYHHYHHQLNHDCVLGIVSLPPWTLNTTSSPPLPHPRPHQPPC